MSDSNALICNVKGHEWDKESHNEHTCMVCHEVVTHSYTECLYCPEGETCTCDRDTQEDHTCPFAAEIHNDSDTLCNCCNYCEQQCADDI